MPLYSYPSFPIANTIHPMSPYSIHAAMLGFGSSSLSVFAATAWPSANLAIFVPFSVPTWMPVHSFFVNQGTTVSGNLDIGVYTLNGNRLASIGGIAASGTSTTGQFYTLPNPITLRYGTYYMAIVCDNTTITPEAQQMGSPIFNSACGMLQQSNAYPLPQLATFETCAFDYVPLFGISSKDFV